MLAGAAAPHRERDRRRDARLCLNGLLVDAMRCDVFSASLRTHADPRRRCRRSSAIPDAIIDPPLSVDLKQDLARALRTTTSEKAAQNAAANPSKAMIAAIVATGGFLSIAMTACVVCIGPGCGSGRQEPESIRDIGLAVFRPGEGCCLRLGFRLGHGILEVHAATVRAPSSPARANHPAGLDPEPASQLQVTHSNAPSCLKQSILSKIVAR